MSFSVSILTMVLLGVYKYLELLKFPPNLGHLGSVPSFVIMNDAAMKICVRYLLFIPPDPLSTLLRPSLSSALL